MASVIVDGARAARDAAQCLRADALGVKLAARRGVRRSQAATTAAAAVTESARAWRTCAIVSPWSGLPWRTDVESVARTLVLLD